MLFRRRPVLPDWRGPRAGSWAREAQDALAARSSWRGVWATAAEGCGLARTVYVAAGVTVTAPRIGAVLEDPGAGPVRLVVEMLAGQTARDYRDRAAVLALALGCARVAVLERGGRWLTLTLLAGDPLAEPYTLPERTPDGFVGIDEDGAPVAVPWAQRGHTVLQGQTGSGKSTGLYGMLAALAPRRDVVVTGVDPSGVLWRAWTAHPGEQWRASGLADELAAGRRVLRALVDELDRRVGLLPDDDDRLTPSPAVPLLVVVLEELPALYRAADLAGRQVGAEVRSLVARLVAEGRKVAVRVVMVAQRADAAVVDGAVRAQATCRVSFAADADALRMLHPAGAVDADEHAMAPPGVAVLSVPGLGTVRLRAGDLSFADYAARVRAAAPTAGPTATGRAA